MQSLFQCFLYISGRLQPGRKEETTRTTSRCRTCRHEDGGLQSNGQFDDASYEMPNEDSMLVSYVKFISGFAIFLLFCVKVMLSRTEHNLDSNLRPNTVLIQIRVRARAPICNRVRCRISRPRSDTKNVCSASGQKQKYDVHM